MRPDGPPVGLQLAVTSKAVSRAFNAALADAGGSVPIWLVLSSLKSEPRRTQLDLARAELAVLYLAVADMLAKPTSADTGTLIGGAVILGLVALGSAVVFASTRAVRLR